MESRPIEQLDLCGGDPALDFVNTLGGVREGPWDDEWLVGYRDLASWSGHAGLLPAPDAAQLGERAADEPARAESAHADALALREVMYRVFAAQAQGAPTRADDLAGLAEAYRDALSHAHLAAEQDRIDWTWGADDDLRRPLWLVAQASVDLLVAGRLDRLRQCAHCRWLFLDASKNRSRRWCSMEHCGTDAKVRRARARRRSARR